MIVLIPAHRPDTGLARFVADLRRSVPDARIIVIDDGSGPDYRLYFDAARAAGAALLSHDRQQGWGSAVRTGLLHVTSSFPGQAVVIADISHSITDIVAAARTSGSTRRISLGTVPTREHPPLGARLSRTIGALLDRARNTRRPLTAATALVALPWDQVNRMAHLEDSRYEHESALLASASTRIREVERIPLTPARLPPPALAPGQAPSPIRRNSPAVSAHPL